MLNLSGWFQRLHPAHEEGERLLQSEKYAEAETCLLTAITEMKNRAVPLRRQAKAHLSLAQAQWKQHKPFAARQTAEGILDALKNDKPSSEHAECLNLLGAIEEHDEDDASALAFYREALAILEKVIPIEPIPLTEQYRKVAEHLRKHEELEEAKALLNQAVETAEKRLGTGAPLTADCLMDLGRILVSMGDKEKGVEMMERAVNIHRETLGATSEEVARDLHDIAAACHKAGDLQSAVRFYELALRVRERQLGGNAEDLAAVLLGLADAHSLLGNPAPAISYLQQAATKLERTQGPRLAEALEDLGDGYVKWGRYGEAVSCYQKARVVWQKDPDKYAEALRINSGLLQEAIALVPPEPIVEGAQEPEEDNGLSVLLDPTAPPKPAGAPEPIPMGHPAYAGGMGGFGGGMGVPGGFGAGGAGGGYGIPYAGPQVPGYTLPYGVPAMAGVKGGQPQAGGAGWPEGFGEGMAVPAGSVITMPFHGTMGAPRYRGGQGGQGGQGWPGGLGGSVGPGGPNGPGGPGFPGGLGGPGGPGGPGGLGGPGGQNGLGEQLVYIDTGLQPLIRRGTGQAGGGAPGNGIGVAGQNAGPQDVVSGSSGAGPGGALVGWAQPMGGDTAVADWNGWEELSFDLLVK